jgi:hypothetical protein
MTCIECIKELGTAGGSSYFYLLRWGWLAPDADPVLVYSKVKSRVIRDSHKCFELPVLVGTVDCG